MPTRTTGRLAVGAALLLGMGLSWMTAGRPVRLEASGTDRWSECVMTTGPVIVMRSKDGSPITTQEALYVLNYRNGLLLAAVPAYKQAAGSVRVLSDFAERDLVKDFGIAPGAKPHFLMTVLDLGVLSDGWSPLVVIETESGQVASYRAIVQNTPGATRPTFQLIERKTDPRLARSMAAAVADAPR